MSGIFSSMTATTSRMTSLPSTDDAPPPPSNTCINGRFVPIATPRSGPFIPSEESPEPVAVDPADDESRPSVRRTPVRLCAICKPLSRLGTSM